MTNLGDLRGKWKTKCGLEIDVRCLDNQGEIWTALAKIYSEDDIEVTIPVYLNIEGNEISNFDQLSLLERLIEGNYPPIGRSKEQAHR